MNPNLKGTLGELAVTQDLLRQGYFVFSETTKHSKTDLIVLSADYKNTYKVQVKTVSTDKSGGITVPTRKCCLDPKYNSVYNKDQNDVYAVYAIDADTVFYISADDFLKQKSSLKFGKQRSFDGWTFEQAINRNGPVV